MRLPLPRAFFSSRLPLCLVLSALLAAACSSSDVEDDPPAEAVEVLYNRAHDKLSERSYKDAVKGFEEVERQHPYSEWAARAQVMAAFGSFKAGEYDDAIGTLERFVKLHPSHESAPYAYYLIALCYYEQISDVSRDQKMTELALKALKEVAVRYPGTDYARDAQLKVDLTVDHLAGKEMKIGRYYQSRQEYLAAVNRFRKVVSDYQTTNHTPEALHRLVECYLELGVKEEAQRYAAVLGHNFPGSDWYRYSYTLMQGENLPEPKKSLLKKILPF